MVSDSPRVLSSASVRGLFRYTARQGFRFAAPWARFSLPSAMQKSRVIPGVRSTPKSGPPARFFGGLTMRLLSTGPLHHIAGACRSATKSGLLLRSPKDCANLILELSHPQRAAFKAVSPAKRNKTKYYFVAFVRAFYLTGLVALPKRNKIRLVVAFAFRDPAFLLSVVLLVRYHKPPSMSTRFSPG